MSTGQEQRRDGADSESGVSRISILKLSAIAWSRRRWIVAVTATGMLLAVGISFLLPKVYTADALVLPSDQQSLQGVSALSILAASGGAESILSTKSPGATAISILGTRTAQDDIINRFGLLHVYHSKLYIDARQELSVHTSMDEDKKTGIVTIAVSDHDRYRARDIAKAYVEELNKLQIQENTSSAHLERVFLEGRLSGLKSELDATSNKLSQFSSRNATFNPQTQSQVLLQSASALQNQLITAQSDLDALKTQYTDDNLRVLQARARVEELQKQVRRLSTGDTSQGTTENSADMSPSIRELPLLGVTYLDLSRQLATQETLYEALTKQYELAKVQEAKEIPTVKILDEPELPERKSGPQRAKIVVLATLFSFFVSLIFVCGQELWSSTDSSSSSADRLNSIWLAIRGPSPDSTT